MRNRNRILAPPIAKTLCLWRYRLQSAGGRLRRAIAYFLRRLDADGAQQLMLDCRDPAGWHLLFILSEDDVLDQAREVFVEHPDLPHLVAAACARVAHKWENGDASYEAHRWAIEIAEGYARDENTSLTRIDALPSRQ